MNKKLALILAVVMLIGIIVPIVASADGVAEKHGPKIKKIFDIGDEYEDFHLNTNNHRGETTY